MRKSLISVCLSIPMIFTVACGDDDDGSDVPTDGGESNAGGAGKSAGSGGRASSGGGMAGAADDDGGDRSDSDSRGGSASGGKGGAAGSNAGAGAPAHVEGGSGGVAGSAGVAGNGDDAGGSGADGDGEPAVANAVYTMSNAAAANQIFGFFRAEDGSLSPMPAPFDTGGKGTGAGLGEQGALSYDVVNRRLYAVNAGDHSFTVFAVEGDGSLSGATTVTTEGFGDLAPSMLGPKSVTFRDDVVYVLFQGDATTPSRVAGWNVSNADVGFDVTPIDGSALTLSSDTQSVDPAQISFSPDGKWLVVTERQTGANGAITGDGRIDTFSVNAAGLATEKGSYPTAPAPGGGLQRVPFGFGFVGNTLVVSEAGSTGTGAYSYANGVITPVPASQFLPTAPAPCWVAVSGSFAYVANAQGPNISGFHVSSNGALSNIGPIDGAIVASTGRTVAGENGPMVLGPTDEAVSSDGKYLYVLNARVPSIGVFVIAGNGTLSRVGASDFTPPEASQLPMGAVGIAAR